MIFFSFWSMAVNTIDKLQFIIIYWGMKSDAWADRPSGGHCCRLTIATALAEMLSMWPDSRWRQTRPTWWFHLMTLRHFGSRRRSSNKSGWVASELCRHLHADRTAPSIFGWEPLITHQRSQLSGRFWRLPKCLKLLGYHSNVPWATVKLMPVL